MADNKIEYLDYDGLKTLVACVLAEMPKPDNVTIVKNPNGTISAQTLYKPAVDTSTGSMVFSDDSPVEVSGETLIFI